MENKCRIIDELLTFEFNLKNDLEMIKICQNNLKYEKNSTKK